MADDNRSFGLSSIREGVRKRREELAHENRAKSRTYDDKTTEGPFKPFTARQEDFDRTEPDKDNMRKYWRQFETTPIVRKPVTSFASQVMSPGYYIKAQGLDESELTKLDHWLETCAILEGERGKNFRKLAKKVIVQREVRGTSFVEKAPSRENGDEIAGLKLINAETMEAVTRPGQSILLDPEDIEEFDDAPEAESGGAAAFLQDLGETETFFGTPVNKDNDGNKVGFRKDEIIKIARDADAGEIFGTSRLESVSTRIEGLKNKLQDNDQAIESKAYPLWLFLFGSEENPWESDDINDFMRAHEMENFHPGMKQGVRGDVDVKTISGEVAELAESLQFDVDWIMSVMPMPKFALGAYSDGVGQIVGMSQQQNVQRQVKDARRDIEDEFTPMLKDVAQQFGFDEDAIDTIRLKVGRPGEPESDGPSRENVIRYVPSDQTDTPEEGPDGSPTSSPGSSGVPSEIPNQPEEDVPEEAGAQVWHTDRGLAELSLESDNRLADKIYNTMVSVRDETLEEVENQYSDTPTFAATNFEKIANRTLRRYTSRGKLRRDVRPIIENHLDEVNESMGTTRRAFSSQQNTRFFVQDVENAAENAIEEMLRLMRIQVRRGAIQDEEWSEIDARVRREYGEASLRQRAELIAHMELKNATENMKLQRYEMDDRIIGVRVVNEDPSTPLTESLAGAEAYFSEGDIQSQLSEKTRDEFLHTGFDPLPPTPPYYFNDTTRLEPIYEE